MQNAVHMSNTRIQRPAVGWSQLCAHWSTGKRAVAVWVWAYMAEWCGCCVRCGGVSPVVRLRRLGGGAGGRVRVSWRSLDGARTHSGRWCGWVGWGGRGG